MPSFYQFVKIWRRSEENHIDLIPVHSTTGRSTQLSKLLNKRKSEKIT